MKECSHFRRLYPLGGRCIGTKGEGICFCGGDRAYCAYYPEIREKYKNRKKVKVRPYRKPHLRKGGGVR